MKRSKIHALTAAALFTLALSSLSCSKGGEGVLIVTTSPIPAEIVVNGTPRGFDRVILTLSAGEHEAAFVPASNQFLTPEPIKARVTKGDTTRVVGVYKSAFIPEEPPQGFSYADTIRYYGTNSQRMKDGTIFDYIDGGALVYLDNGLRLTAHALFRHTDGSELVVDIFDMGNSEQALKAFNDEMICPAGFETIDIGEGGKTYNFSPDYMLYFHKANYLVYLSTTNDYLKNDVITFAKTIAGNVK